MRPRRSLLFDGLLAAAILGLLALAVARLDRANEQALAGRVRVIDGDTLALGGTRVRLVGLDAPELAQLCQRDGAPWTCGEAARLHLDRLIAGRPVECEAGAKDRYGRMLALCTAGTVRLNPQMVADGYAVAFGDYAAEEDNAQAAGRGLWAGTFDRPRDWRARHGGMAEAPHMTRDLLHSLWHRIETLWTAP